MPRIGHGVAPAVRVEQEVSVGGTSAVAVLSADGRTMLVSGGPSADTETYLRSDGAEPVRLAAGRPLDLSPDARLALLQQGQEVVVVPVGPGLPRKIESGVRQPAGARFVPPDGSRVLIWGRERDDDPPRLVLTPTEGGPSRVLADGRLASSLVAAPGHRVAISPDGRLAAAVSADGAVTAVPLDGGDARRLGALPSGYFVSRWSADGRSLLVARAQAGVSRRLARLDLGSGRLQVLRDVAPHDPAGINDCIDFTASGDGSAYAGVHTRCLTDLVRAEGLR